MTASATSAIAGLLWPLASPRVAFAYLVGWMVLDPAGAASLAVERALSWLSCWRRLQVRWDRSSERWFAFVLLACALTCFKGL